VTTVDYQRALSDLIADPALCLDARRDAEGALAPYDLTPREKRRLAGIVHQKGMSVCCTLYRMNRLTPLATLLPLTCQLLGDERFFELATQFWRLRRTEMQYSSETEAFRDYLEFSVAGGRIDEPCLLEVINFEVALNRLQFGINNMSGNTADSQTEVVHFSHNPQDVLVPLSDGQSPLDPAEVACTVTLRLRSGTFEMSVTPAADARHA
jgi:hypothetical protein